MKEVQKEKLNELEKITREERKSKAAIYELKEQINDYYRVLTELAEKHAALNATLHLILRRSSSSRTRKTSLACGRKKCEALPWTAMKPCSRKTEGSKLVLRTLSARFSGMRRSSGRV